MPSGVLDKLQAAPAETLPRFRGIPGKLDARSVGDTMRRLGLAPQATIAAAGKKFVSLDDVNKALTAHGVSVSERMRFKDRLGQLGLLAP